ncbi:MAG: 1-acyl-sn-glycerol-3-phosphate acyltransferase [Holophagales bacterium]|nr:1-acyl-sn-glycerol-3-phosphate acyltransferase [Holophagales bacterium]
MERTSDPRRASLAAVVVATVVGNLYLVFGTLLFATLALVVVWLPPRGRWFSAVARLWARGVLASSGVRVEVAQEAALAPGERRIYVANHQSLFDIPALLATLPGEVRFLAKGSLFRYPVFGQAIRAGGFIPVDRRDTGSARESFTAAIAGLERGVSILLFPEAERTLDGRVLPFQKGGFLLALKSGLPVVPVGVDGTFWVQHRRSFTIRPGRVDIRYGRPEDLSDASVRRLRPRIEEVRSKVAELARAELAPAPGERDNEERANG